MLIQEDADEIVGEIMDELLSKVMESCLKVDIDRQLIPFCASWAMGYLTQTLECQVLCLDEGEDQEEASRTEDSEPVPGIPDAWAEGCVPVIYATHGPHLTSQQEVDGGQVLAQTELSVNQQYNVVAQTESSSVQTKNEISLQSLVSDKHCKVVDPCLPRKTDPKKKQQIHLSARHVQGKLLPPLSCSPEKKDVEVEGKNIRHSVQSQHPQKNCHRIPKLDKLSLPQHCLFPQFEIVDNNYTKSNLKKPNGLSRLEPRYNKQQADRTLPSLKPLTSSKDQPKMFQRQSEDDPCLKKLSPSKHGKEQTEQTRPLRLETMILAKGVSLSNPQSVELNPLKFNNPTQFMNLRPIQRSVAVPLYSVDQLTSGPPPQVTPLFQPKSCEN
ncbi:uncharacterized protein C2orf81 homolog [Stegastes partitus]|nr:PREDICTED: uncharacterized protein C2orf81 homolog [Stegastes partitus]